MDEKTHTTYTFRFPISLKDRLKTDAEKHARSVNQHVVSVMTAYLDGDLIAAEKLLSEPAVRKLLRAAIELRDEKPKRRSRP